MKKLRTLMVLVLLASVMTSSYGENSTLLVRIDSQSVLSNNNGPAKVFELDTPSTDRAFSFQLRTGKYWTMDQFDQMTSRWETLFTNLADISFNENTQMIRVVWDQGDINEMDDLVARFGYTGYAFSA